MKKLIVIVIGLIFVLGAGAQSILDKETYVEFQYDTTNIIQIDKDAVKKIESDGTYIYLYSGTSRSDLLERVNPSTFGWSNVLNFKSYLAGIFFRSYRVDYAYNASSLVDTIFYYSQDSLVYRIVYTYSGTDVSRKSAPINE